MVKMRLSHSSEAGLCDDWLTVMLISDLVKLGLQCLPYASQVNGKVSVDSLVFSLAYGYKFWHVLLCIVMWWSVVASKALELSLFLHYTVLAFGLVIHFIGLAKSVRTSTETVADDWNKTFRVQTVSNVQRPVSEHWRNAISNLVAVVMSCTDSNAGMCLFRLWRHLSIIQHRSLVRRWRQLLRTRNVSIWYALMLPGASQRSLVFTATVTAIL